MINKTEIQTDLRVQRAHPDAVIPSKAHAGDLGLDLYSMEQVTLLPGQTKLVSTGIRCQFPTGYGAFLKDRSSVASKRHLFIKAGVIDNGYTGEIKILFHSQSEDVQTIYIGDKIAQMVLIPVVNCDVVEADIQEDFSTRGSGGFGSTGS